MQGADRRSLIMGVGALLLVAAAPTPTPTPAPVRAPSVSRSPSAAPLARPTSAPSATATPSAQPSATTTRTATPSPTRTVLATLSPTPQVTPTEEPSIDASVDWQAFVPTDTADHLATMDRAARDSGCGVPWQLLAAIARVESDFGRNMATSSAGAIGYGQFLPSSWEAFGSEGNAYDYRDALPAIAQYLCKAGLARDPRAALFAYNHADWYVDLVLSLAVRYDRMAPGAPTPDVLSVAPTEQQAVQMRYASGRDVDLQLRPRSADRDVRWNGIPWHGRQPGEAISARALDTATLTMLRAALGLRGDAAFYDEGAFVGAAWDNGLLGLPSGSRQWTLAELRAQVEMGRPVVALVKSTGLPGHPPDEVTGDQPLVIVGKTRDGLIYNDPTFSSSLGYGLELSEVDFLSFWGGSGSEQSRQAWSFVARPKPRGGQTHLRDAEPPEVIARVMPTPTPTPPPPTATLVPATVGPTVVPTADPVVPEAEASTPVDPPSGRANDYSWALVAVAGTLLVSAVVLSRRLRQ
jgi:hypothetical protein